MSTQLVANHVSGTDAHTALSMLHVFVTGGGETIILHTCSDSRTAYLYQCIPHSVVGVRVNHYVLKIASFVRNRLAKGIRIHFM